MKTVIFADFLSENSKNDWKTTKNKKKIIKNGIFKISIVTIFLLIFGADILRIAIAILSLAMNIISNLTSSH